MQKRAKVLSSDQLDHCMKVHTGPREQLALALTHYAALRVFETAALKIKDVLHPNGTVKDAMHIHGKGDKWRSVPISTRLRSYILAALPADYEMDWPLVPSKGLKRHFNPTAFSHWLTLRYQEAGFYSCTGNSGRRSAMTRMHRNRTPLKIIKEIVGHQSLQVTAAYIEVDDMEMADAVNCL